MTSKSPCRSKDGFKDTLKIVVEGNLIHVGKSVEKWRVLRDEIHHDIMTNAWHKDKKAFTQSYHSEHLDASVLLMEYYGFIDGKDDKFVGTVKAIEKELMH